MSFFCQLSFNLLQSLNLAFFLILLTQVEVYRNTSELTAKKHLKVSFMWAIFSFYPVEFSVCCKACFKDGGLAAI